MKQTRATIRYAKAFLGLAIEQNSLEASFSDMRLLERACFESKDLSLLLKSPIVKTDQKIKIFQEIFDGKIQPLSMAFVKIIIQKKREYLLEGMAKKFIDLYKMEKNIATATVTTALPITEKLKQEVISYIKKRSNNQVELTEVINKDILGGAIIRIGDKQLDASIASNISELKQTFNKNLYVQDL